MCPLRNPRPLGRGGFQESARSYSADLDEQRTYERGYAEGREILRAHGADEREVA